MFSKQKCITVGYVPTAAVAATRCQYMGGTHSHLGADPSPRRNMDSTRQEATLPEQNDKRFWKYYIPLRSVIRETHIATESLGVDGFVSDDGCSRDVGSQHISFP